MDLREWREAEEPTSAEIKRRRRALRKRKNGLGLTQVEAAQRLGISQQYLAYIEAGAREPSAELRVRINKMTGGKVPPETFDAAAEAENRNA